ncbi:TVP38/TMEM64 family protein [Fictibacillus nanhaiensis]|uniref:TVP38/TMEM64 family protein n=1 Tax=Fictibacillus nanhaiensis TaxID=742169 RepID=UPI001C9721AE|nr:TVP38/TMEM64 family protein [Fictibacillus nanhaiensis]MBY6035797.1 TVP38/TMEM64 family protein [Fictibacillus nanhaiensis]
MKSKTILQLFAVAVIIGILIYVNQTVFNITPETLKNLILSIGVVAPLVYVVIYSVRPFVLFPASVLSLAGGLAFGPLYGTLLTIIGASIGALLAFLFARKIGAGKLESKWGDKTTKLQKILENNGFTVIILLRLIPLFNFDLISYAAGLSKIKLSHFLIGTVLGIIPGTFAYSFLGASTVSDNKGIFLLAIVLFGIVTIIPALFRKRIKQYIAAKEEN